MTLSFIRKELNEIFFQNINKPYCSKITSKFGADYSVLGIDLFLVNQISEVLIESLKSLATQERVALITELVTSNEFERMWLGYSLWANSIETFNSLDQSDILHLRPAKPGVFNHYYATVVLPWYINAGKVNRQVFIQLVDSKCLSDQMISLRSFMLVSQKSIRYRNLAIQLLKNRNWLLNNEEVTRMIVRLAKYYKHPMTYAKKEKV